MIRSAGNFGFTVYYGDGTRLDVLRTSGAGKADAILVCIDKPELADRIVEDSAVKSWQLAFHTVDHAKRFHQAYCAFLGAKHDGKSVSVQGSRVAIVEAPTELALRAALPISRRPPLRRR